MTKKETKKTDPANTPLAARHTQVLHDIKWKKFLRSAKYFRHIPFVEFVFGAGSMARGDVSPHSDFDVIVSATKKRIFTARFFSMLFFEFSGSRRKKIDHHESAADKICLNHFVTEESFCLSAPYGPYRRTLYKNLVPLFGTPEQMNTFWKANEKWMRSAKEYSLDARHIAARPSALKKIIETGLSGRLGDIFEAAVKYTQVKRIEKGLAHVTMGYRPRMHWSDKELEFHPDTSERS